MPAIGTDGISRERQRCRRLLRHAELLHLPRDHIRQRTRGTLAVKRFALTLETLVHVRTALVQLLQRLLALGLRVVVPRQAGLDRTGWVSAFSSPSAAASPLSEAEQREVR